jgi:hypothetical protein
VVKRWFNNTGSAKPIGANSGGNLTYWFADAAHTTKITVVQGIPAAGDIVFWDQGYADLAGATPVYWNAVTISPGQTVQIEDTTSAVPSLDIAGATIGAGTTFQGTTIAAVQGLSGTIWLGDMLFDGWATIALASWKVNGGATGGSISATNIGVSFMLNGADAGQVARFANVTATGSGLVTINFGLTMELTGTMTLQYQTITVPSGNWVTLVANGASAFGVTIGHVPSVNHVLPSDNVFGETGTGQGTKGFVYGG